MKKLLKTIILLTLLVITACAVAACGVESITIAEDDMPQTVYVVGSELNLNDGKLTVKTKDGEKKVALNSSDVSVKGYDKDTLGEQTLTVTYKKQKTELNVKVVERAVISGYVSDYFVGDSFDKTQGRMQITRDNGSQYSVFLSDEKVSIENFNSTSPASSLTVAAKYSNGEISYSGTFPVNVYAVDSIALKKPTKLEYFSHDTDINLVGGKLTLKGNNGELVKEIALTKSMVSGFDLSEATDEHRAEPLEQTLTVSYLNKTLTYKIEITYTDVSKIKENASELAELDWSKTTPPVLTEVQGEKAMDTMRMYLDLPTSLKALITEEERLAFARPAMVYGYDIYADDLQNYEKAFEIDEYGDIVLVCETRDDTENVISLLADKTLPFYEMGDFLSEIIRIFATFEVYSGKTFEEYAVYDPVTFDVEVLPSLDFMVQAYDKLAPVADEWTSSELSSNDTYKNAIEATYAFIKDSNYYYTIFDAISAWRTNGDYFDVLYTYYYGLDDDEAITKLSAYGFPGTMDDLLYYVISADEQITYMFGYQYPLVVESSGFMINYFEAIETADAIKNGADAMLKDLYSTLTLNYILGSPDTDPVYFDDMITYLKNTSGGYQSLCGGFYGITAYENLISKYVSVMKKYFEDEEEYKASAAYDTDMKALLNDFVALTPVQQSSFLTTIHIMYNPTYPTASLPEMAFDYKAQRENFDGEAISFFVDFISDYYESKLTSDVLKNTFADLLLAVEYYSQGYMVDGAMDNFIQKLGNVTAAYTVMEGENKSLFETYLKPIYEKYVKISTYLGDGFTATDLGDYADEFALLEDVMINAQIGVYFINSGMSAYTLMFSAFEKAFDLEKQILASGDEDIINAYYYEQFNFNTEEEPYYCTYDYMLNAYRGYYISALTSFYGSYNVYGSYMEEEGFREFVKDTYDITWTYLFRSSAEDETEKAEYQYDSTSIYKAMNGFKELSLEAQALFVMFEGEDFAFYYVGLADFFGETLTDNASSFAKKVIDLEMKYIAFVAEDFPTIITALEELIAQTDPSEKELIAEIEAVLTEYEEKYATGINDIKALIADMDTAYSNLTGEEQAELTEVKAIYDYYKTASQELIDEYENQGVTE